MSRAESRTPSHEAFDEAGRLRDRALAERLQREVVGFVRLAEAVRLAFKECSSPETKARKAEIVKALEDESELQLEG